ncbi:MAG: citramalate synthase [Firmicutes bacterium]|nr:citramalate synthase [Bacillota bacterium]
MGPSQAQRGLAVEIYDTTLRDGAQREGISYSVHDKLRILERLDHLGVGFVEGGWPGANPKDSEFFRLASRLRLHHTVLVAFGSTCRPGTQADRDTNLRALLEAGTSVVTLFGKSWDFQVTTGLGTTEPENLRMIRDSVAFLVQQGRQVFFDAEHFFDGYRADRDYALATLLAAAKAGAQRLVLCDTNGGSLPDQVGAAARYASQWLQEQGYPVPLGIHAHNDGGLAVANSLAAVAAGIVQVQGTINGYGERCGNADLCTVIPNLQLKMGCPCLPAEKLAQLTEISRFVAETANLSPDSHQPYVGRSAFAHKGGVHVSALLKAPQCYEHIEPERVGNRRRVLVSDLAGASNVRYKAVEYGLDEAALQGGAAQRTIAVLKQLENEGHSFEGAEASFELLLRRNLGLLQEPFQLEGFRLWAYGAAGTGPVAEATVKVRIGDEVIHTVAEGDGPVNALDRALRQALQTHFRELAEMRLTDYKVRVLDEKDGTAARVRVLIQSSGWGRTWGTVGVHANIIEASWQALADSIVYGLMVARPRAEQLSPPVESAI